MPPKTKDFSAGVYTGLKSCPPHPAVDRAVQTDACLLPVGPMVISDDALRAALRARGLVGIPLEDLERQIIANIALHLRLDPTHSMEMLFTMWRVPRAVVEKMWGRWTPSQQDNDVILYEWLEIERVMNLVNLEPHLQWGMKNAKLHKVSAPKSRPIHHHQLIFSPTNRPPPCTGGEGGRRQDPPSPGARSYRVALQEGPAAAVRRQGAPLLRLRGYDRAAQSAVRVGGGAQPLCGRGTLCSTPPRCRPRRRP